MDTDNGLCPKHGADLISNLVSLIITQTFSLLLLSFLEGGGGRGGKRGSMNIGGTLHRPDSSYTSSMAFKDVLL